MKADFDLTGSLSGTTGVTSSSHASPQAAPRPAGPPSTMADNGGGDVAGDSTSTATIAIGATVTGDISSAADQDWYAVTLTAGQSYYFNLASTGGTPLGDPGLKIYGTGVSNQGGVQFADNDGGAGNNAGGFFQASYTGTYFIAAQGFGGATGGYSLSVADGPVDDIGDGNYPMPAPGTITAGGSVTSSLSSGTDIDVFAITLEAGHTYLVTLSGTASAGLPALDGAQFGVFNAPYYGGQLGIDTQQGDGDPAHVVVTPATTGTYYVEVNPYRGSGVGGGYTVSVGEPPADIAASVATTATLAIGGTVASYIDNGSDADWVGVTLEAGKTYTFHMDAPGANYLDPKLTLISGAGTSLVSDDNGGGGNSALIRYTAATSGTYFLKAYAVGAGEYNLSAAEAPADVAGDATTTASLAIGQEVPDYLSSTADRDWYSVSLTAGQAYVFSLHQVAQSGGSASPLFELRSQAGTVLASDRASGAGDDDQIVYTATTSGTFFLGFGFTGSTAHQADYVLGARTLNDIGANGATSQAITVGQTYSSLFDFNADHDRFAITLQKGLTYDLTLDTYLSPEAHAVLSVYSSTGAKLIEATYGGDTRYSTVRFTATSTGTYYLDAGTYNDLLHTAGYTISAKVSDSIPASTATTATLTVGGSVAGTVDFSDSLGQDFDWYAITLSAGQGYVFTVAPGASGGISSPQVSVYSAAGVLFDTYSSYTSAVSALQFYAAASGTYYVSAGSASQGGLGGYTVSAATTNDVFDGRNTHHTLAIGSSFQSTIDASGDQDWFKVDLIAGQSYVFTVDQNGASPLTDCYVSLYDTLGAKLAYDDDGGVWPNSVLRYTPLTSGTYYVAATGFTTAVGGYTVGAKAVAPQDPLKTIDWGTHITNTAVTVYFAQSGETFETNTASRAWTAAEKTAFMAACQTWSAVTNVSFTQVSSAAAATMVVVLKPLSGNTAAFMDTPPGTPQVGVFDPDWGATIPAAGSVWFTTFIHEVGHFLGLAHPHDGGGSAEVMEGVYTQAMDGVAGLNHGIYTVMSYNEAVHGLSSWLAGDVSTPMALDAALVQQKYGATVHNAGNDVYDLGYLASGGEYRLIWDTGGTDTIVATITGAGATIDLRPATLLNAQGGGGYLSAVLGVETGFTIAHGVMIENATGNSGNDALFGNDVGNVLSGMAGDDVLVGGAGADVLDGGAGIDTISYVTAASGVTVFLGGTQFNTGDAAGDSYAGVENLTGTAFSDILGGDDGANVINGGDGNDWLAGSGGNDTLSGGNGNDVIEGGAGADYIDGGGGINVVSYRNSASGIAIDRYYAYGTAGDSNGDQLLNVQNMWGSNYADTIKGDDSGTQVYGFGGDDTLDGRGGDDVFYGGTGADTITTGFGADDIFFLSYNNHTNQFGTPEPYEGGDTITDFTHGTDHITVSRYWFGFGNIGGPAAALTSANADFITSGGPASAKPTFFWNAATGLLEFDPDGTGAGARVNLATLTGATVSLSDIWTA